MGTFAILIRRFKARDIEAQKSRWSESTVFFFGESKFSRIFFGRSKKSLPQGHFLNHKNSIFQGLIWPKIWIFFKKPRSFLKSWAKNRWFEKKNLPRKTNFWPILENQIFRQKLKILKCFKIDEKSVVRGQFFFQTTYFFLKKPKITSKFRKIANFVPKNWL